MGKQDLLISAIIVSYNTRQMTLDCLGALYAGLGQMPAEVWVVDNDSTDGSAEAIHETFPQAKLIANLYNAGFAAANNQAIRSSCGEFLLLLNSDAFLSQGALTTLVAHMKEREEVAVVGPKLLNADGSLQRSCYRFPGPWRTLCENVLLTAAMPNSTLFGDYRAWSHDRVRDVDMIIGACMLVRRSALDRVGLFDENFFLYAEETDLCYRLHKAGLRTNFLPTAEVTHLNGGSGRQLSDRVFCEFRRGQEKFFRKHYGVSGLLFYRLMMTLGSCLRLSLFALIGAVSRKRRLRCVEEARLWKRILKWTVGSRGPGLSELYVGRTQ